MRTFIVCFLSLFLFVNAYAQNNDSLITVLEGVLQQRIDSLGEEHLDVAVFADSLGNMYLDVGKYTQADTLLRKALNIKLENFNENHLGIADSYYELGRLYRRTGNYTQAINFNNKALNIRLELLDERHPTVANAYDNSGIIYYYTGDYRKTISFHNKALDIRLEIFGKKHREVAKSYNNLGIVYEQIGDYKKAISFHNKALDIRLEIFGEKHREVASSYINLGTIYEETSDYEKAINSYNKAINIFLDVLGERHPNIALPYNNLGIVYRKTGDYKKAISFYNKAISIRLEVFGEKHPYVARSYNNLGNVYGETGDYEKAISFHSKALKIKVDTLGEEHPYVASSYSGLGNTYYLKGDYEKAISFHDKALNIWLEVFGKKHREVANSYNNLGIVYKQIGDYKKAISFHDKALSIWFDILGEKHPNVLKSYNNLATAYEKIGNYNAADSLWQIVIPQSIQQLKSNYSFLPDEQRIKYVNTIVSTNTNFYSFVAANGTESTIQLATNYLLNTKSLALDYGISTKKIIKKINDTALNLQYEQLNNLNKQIADAQTFTSEERKEKGWDLSEMNNQRETLTFQMLQHPKLKSKLNTKTIKWQDIQNKLTPNEATLDFVKFYEDEDSTWQYHAMLIRKDTTPQFIPITKEKAIRDLMEFYEENKLPVYLQNQSTRTALYDKIWSSLDPHLEGIATIHLSPAGLLHKVDFETLQNDEGQYLAERFEFHYYSAMRDFVQPKPTQSYKDAVLMGHILYDIADIEAYKKFEDSIDLLMQDTMLLALRDTRDNIEPLKATAKEVKIIGKICKRSDISPTVLTIAAATEDTLQYFTGERAPSILHFATHGVFLEPLDTSQTRAAGMRDRLRIADNPLQRSALMLYGANHRWTKNGRILGSEKDGILTALEVANLDLKATDLVVLSACNTGLGSIHNTEGVFGLQRAFKLAGVDNILVSLWPVNDRTTKELMIRFYRNLLKKEQSPAVALRNAKAEMRKQNASPRQWAGFILVE